MTAETNTESIYTDVVLSGLLDDRKGDINAVAADIWEEKAATIAGQFDFEADGGKFSRSQQYAQYLTEAAKYRGRVNFQLDPELKAPEDV